ncbi:hypothetical protein [Candidatus Leptofilum sp.]|uniref:hypothetical protein n=1 Tax=Candidatus Leptofilum sp. TaxID=3241576 RepID=UPI003B5A1BE0
MFRIFRHRLAVFSLGSLVLLLLIGCGGSEEALPTLAPLVVLPSPTATSLPPTLDISTRPPESGVASAGGGNGSASAEATPKPTITPTPVNPLINISDPNPNQLLTLGSEVEVRGLVQMESDQSIQVALWSSNSRLLTEVAAVPNEFGWQTSFVLPPYVSGAATMRANLLGADGSILSSYDVPVWLTLNKETATRYLELFRPTINAKAVGGFNIFFDGEILLPVNRTVTISIWADDCQTRVARQSFVLGASNRPVYWQGFVVVPQELVGPACAVASTGEPGTENWREASVPINVLAQTELEARGVTIGNPPPDDEVFAGQELFLYGTAYNVSEGPVSVSILMENGRVVSQTSFSTDYWGYWETAVTLPIDIEGLAEITVAAGEGDTFNESTTIIRVNPAPTPTPGP